MLHLWCFFFFFNDTATTEIYTLSLHDALPIWTCRRRSITRSASATPSSRSAVCRSARTIWSKRCSRSWGASRSFGKRSEEHTSELQSQSNLVCRLLLEKKKNIVDLISL